MDPYIFNKASASYIDFGIAGGRNPYEGRVIHRHLNVSLPIVDRGEGIYLYDKRGRRYIDASGGAAVSALGHSDPDVIGAIKDQLDRVSFAHTGFFTSEPLEELADILCDRAPESIDHAYIVSGGSEAVESALKLARQYFTEQGKPTKRKFIGRKQSYHGNTIGALGVGGNVWRKEQFEAILVRGILIDPCYEYRLRHEGESDEEYGLRAANALEERILEEGPDTIAAFVAETVVGATAGALAPVGSYFKRIREICDHYDVLLILDEVMCGCGRTGTFFAFEQEGITPDMVTLAKALGAGYQPVGATLVSSKIVDVIRQGSGFFQHGHTYLGHTVACAAAVAVQKKLDSANLMENVRQRGERMRSRLQDANNAFIGDIRGRGLFIGLELVQDRAEKEPFGPEHAVSKRIKAKAMENGLICYPMSGTVDGKRGDHVLLAPPFISTEEQVDEIVDIISDTIRQACEPLI